MESLQYLYELMEKDCSIAVLGYRAEHEQLKDEFVSRLNHYKIEEINSSFDVLSIVRDIKINSVINGDKFDWLVLDINDVVLNRKDNDNYMGRPKELRSILEKFRTEIHKKFEEDNKTEFGLDFDDPLAHQPIEFNPNFRLLVTTPMYKSPGFSKDTIVQKFSSGDSTLYISDLVFHFDSGDKLFSSPHIKVIKCRFGPTADINIDDIIKTVNRDRKISTLFK